MARHLHDEMMARVTENWTVSETFTVTNEVKQGRVLDHAPFGLIFSAMLIGANRNEPSGIRTASRIDDHLLDIRHMQASTRLFTSIVHDLFFADDCALNTVTEAEMQ
ncbi:hypothetical protein SprV_0200978600 [Sparganum proliferum]